MLDKGYRTRSKYVPVFPINVVTTSLGEVFTEVVTAEEPPAEGETEE